MSAYSNYDSIAFDRTERPTTTRLTQWIVAAWLVAYGLLTATFALLGVLLAVTLGTLSPWALFDAVIVFTVGIGAFAVSPTIARLVLLPIKHHLDRESAMVSNVDPSIPEAVEKELLP